MKNLDMIFEAVIDPTRKGLDSRVFDDINNEYHMKSYLRRQLHDIMQEINEQIVPVRDWFIKGSILSNQWLDWSDIDVLIEIDEDITDEHWHQLWEEVDERFGDEILAGTEHPIEIFLNRGEYDKDRTEGLYDVDKDQWVKGPYDIKVDLNHYVANFKKEVKSFDLALGELERDLTDYLIYQSLTPEELSALSDQVTQKVREINREVDAIIKQALGIKAARKKAFSKTMDPEEIVRWGSKSKLPANVIQKMLERYKYMAIYKALKKIRKMENNPEKIDSPREIEKLKDLFHMPSESD